MTKRKPYKIAGYAHDGTPILKPKMKPTHFTVAQIKKTIMEVHQRLKEKKEKKEKKHER